MEEVQVGGDCSPIGANKRLTCDNRHMVNGPPTPPPTTVTELQDEAREHPPVAETSTALPQNRTENYQHVLASINEATSNKDYSQVINIAQETDYEVSSPLSLSFYSLIHLRF